MTICYWVAFLMICVCGRMVTPLYIHQRTKPSCSTFYMLMILRVQLPAYLLHVNVSGCT
uniref:Uncharacterized protein n=1 Tax=Rhizophora mucronata TaxID=61149 RepID=A0A2P2R292_RHIMU